MAHTTALTAADGHELSAYLAEPAGPPRGGIVVIQEIFGVTGHIRAVADRYAAEGYLAVAPALFDRQESGVDVPYTDLQRAFGYMKAANLDAALLDIGAAVQRLRPPHVAGDDVALRPRHLGGGGAFALQAIDLRLHQRLQLGDVVARLHRRVHLEVAAQAERVLPRVHLAGHLLIKDK